MRVSEKDLKRSEELVKQLEKIETEGKAKMLKEVEKVNSDLLDFYPQYEKATILKDRDLIVEAINKLNTLYHKRQSLKDDFYRTREDLNRQIEMINLGYIDGFSKSILEEARRLLEMRDYVIVDKQRDMVRLMDTYTLKHNYDQIGKIVNMLGEKNKEFRAMHLSPLRKIKETYDKAISAIPEDFPLEGQGTFTETEFFGFQQERSNVVFDISQRYINFYGTPGFFPKE